MAEFWHSHRKLKILTGILLGLVLLICVVPYLIPLGKHPDAVPPEALVTGNGSFLDIEGIKIYIEEQGSLTSPEAVLFLHGLGGSTFSWRDNIPFFAGNGFRVVAVDMQGFGISHKDYVSDYSHPAQARIIGEVLNRLGIDRVYIVGHSMGTSVMLHFTHLHPEKVVGLISVGGAVTMDKSTPFPSLLLRFGPFQRAGRIFLTRYLNRDRLRTILESAYYHVPVSQEIFDGYYLRIINGNWDQALMAMTRDMRRNAITFPLESMTFPVLIIHGENDTWVTRQDIDKWKDRIPFAEFISVTQAGHMVMEEYPAFFNERVLEFIKIER